MKISNQSTWQDSQENLQFPSLKQNTQTDVVIVGGGLAGILTAYTLAKAGKKITVLESKKSILSYTTMYTTAFLTQSIDTDFTDLVKMFGNKNTKLIWQSHQDAIELISNIAKNEKIACEFKRISNYAYANNEKEFSELEKEYNIASKLGFDVNLHKKLKVGFSNAGALEIKNQAKYDPLKFAQRLAEKCIALGVKIYTNSEVKEIQSKKVITIKTTNAEIITTDVIVATYQPFNNPKEVKLKKGMYQTYVYEAEIPTGKIKEGLYEDMQNPYHYLRIDKGQKNDRLIAGGEDHRQEIKGLENKSFKGLEKYLQETLANTPYTIKRKWTGPILEPVDGLALIGQYKPHQYVATAFSGNGMTYSGITAMLLKDLILGKKNRYTEIYQPSRKMPLKNLALKGRDYIEELGGGAIKNLIKN